MSLLVPLVTDDPTQLANSFGMIFLVVAVLGIAGFTVIIVSRARKLARVLKSSSNRLMFDGDLPTAEAQPTSSSTDSRLATLDALMMQGKITADEYSEARAKVLGES